MAEGPGSSPDAPDVLQAELLGGLPARRASAILFAIEAHTARLMASARITRATYVSRRGAAEREHAFLEALSAGRDLPLTPTVHDLERFAPQWAHLVPEGVEARAAVAILLASKYRLPAARTPRLQTALGVDRADVAEAIARQAKGRSIFVPSLSVRERVAWWRAGLAQRIERLPPFWIAYALALTETITEGIMVVPIAVAGIGPVAGVVVLLVLGLINLVTLGALVEAITRNGSMRYGAAYFGRLVGELLGGPGRSACRWCSPSSTASSCWCICSGSDRSCGARPASRRRSGCCSCSRSTPGSCVARCSTRRWRRPWWSG